MENGAQPTLTGMDAVDNSSKHDSQQPHADPKAGSSDNPAKKKARTSRGFPATAFSDALTVGQSIQKFASGQKVRRIRLFELMGKSPDSGASRQLVTSSGQYGITKGAYNAEHLELTQEGFLATDESSTSIQIVQARFTLSVASIAPFAYLYEKYKGNKIPARDVLIDNLKDYGVEAVHNEECVDTFTVNAKFIGLLRTVVGSERLLSIEQVLEELPPEMAKVAQGIAKDPSTQVRIDTQLVDDTKQRAQPIGEDFGTICFYVTPIGEIDSLHRRHADFMLEFVVRPAIKEFGLTVVRADQMSQPGMIGRQVVKHILKCKLVIADLSFHNPNVFYELCLRHTTRLPTVQLKREADRLPFDLNQQRTISINTDDIYGLYPKIQTHVSEVATQVRSALADQESADNPISLYYPKAKLTWE